MATHKRPRQRVVILGGGFAGVYAAKNLERLIANRDDIELVLINRENYFVFQPLLAEVVSGSIGVLDTVSPLRRLLPRTNIFVREIESIDVANRKITLSPGFRPRPHVVEFDHLVIALGTVTDFRGMPGLFEHAIPFKSLADALLLRNHLIHTLEEASIESNPELREQLLTFVVAGGGFSGVEVAAEMNDFLRHLARKQYRQLDPKMVRVILVHSGTRVLERELNERLGVYAQAILQRRGIEFVLGDRLKTASPDAAILASGRRISTKTLVSTVPSSPHPLVETLSLPKLKGKIEVDSHLRVKDHPNIWAIGDCAAAPTPDGLSPPTAQHAVRQAETLAHNLAAALSGKEMKTFDFTGLGKMGSLGHHRAVAELFGRVRLSGFFAWLLWRTVYWWKLPGIDRKLKVGLSWLSDLVIPPESVQLKLGGAQGMSQAHFEPGEEVFHQGDLGDSLYMILEGVAEVVVERAGQEVVLSRLKAGDYFGEMALLNQRVRSATVRCVQALSVLKLRKTEFTALAANLPELRRGFENVMNERLAADAAQSTTQSPTNTDALPRKQ